MIINNSTTCNQPSNKLTLEESFKLLEERINSPLFLVRSRISENDFIRNRKLPFPCLIIFMLHLVKSSTKQELDTFFEKIGLKSIDYTQQSFSEARQKVHYEAFIELNNVIVDAFYEKNYKTWREYRLLAIDGSKIRLPNLNPELGKIFGTYTNKGKDPTAQASILLDILNNVTMDAIIAPLASCERLLAHQHIEKLISHPSFKNELILYDRGYASFEMIEYLIKNNIKFVMRLRKKFNIDIDSLPNGITKFTLNQDEKKIEVKVVKFPLTTQQDEKGNPDEIIETLITNLFEEDLTVDDFKELYFLRWPIETKYCVIKQKIKLENFSGVTELAISQDFHINILCSNLITIAGHAPQEELDEQYINEKKNGKNEKVKRKKVNINYSIGILKKVMMNFFYNPLDRIANIFEYAYNKLLKNTVPERLGRKYSRDNPRNDKFPMSYKATCY